MTEYFKRLSSQLTKENIITKIIISFIAVSFVETAFSPYCFNDPLFFSSINIFVHLLFALLIFLSLFFLVNDKYNPYILILLSVALFFITNFTANDVYFALISSALVSCFIFYYCDKFELFQFGEKTAKFLSIAMGILFFLFVGGLTTLFYLSYRSPNFDFGIFSQMFHYMKETLIPYTTCERDFLLSHFAIHFSPILYLILPFYCIFPHPATLLFVQAAVVALGSIPLYKLSKKHGLSNRVTVLIICLYLFHPTVIANNFYYFHENCFLTVFLLWLFYFAEEKKTFPTFLFAFLTMAVKEDAPVYVFLFGLYLLFSGKSKLKGILLSIFSSAYFLTVASLMKKWGNGIMSNRYGNYIFEQDGTLVDAVINMIKDPVYVLQQMMSAEKLEFLICMLVPLALIPIMIKKPSRIMLLCPIILVNLMTNYTYQFKIDFQYTYASSAFLLYLTVLNLKDLDKKYAKKCLICTFCATLIFFSAINLGKSGIINAYIEEKEEISVINKTLDSIPEDKSIRATTYIVPALWNRNEIYEYHYSDEKTDYVIIDLRNDNFDFNRFFSNEGDLYEEIVFEEGIIAVYKAK